MERPPAEPSQPGSERVAPPPQASDAPRAPIPAADAEVESCDWCGSTDLWWRNCKLLCRSCSAIVKSCADL
ncbi:MAG: hypothetical protein HOQ17_08995 [Gemmatimonadaceae bacterium]|nr:hypothetical protein [Gemmatimonadaceae bacterium]NUO94771.1 hypothetical protein [Gemmatimonadaceae bacterium]NUP56476.1 hypothetical protein [Gemmatimonadaceae bacterium]NUP69837.1 hypothetical protein [Gemmatimonadaceae bacterium]NUR34610.1 hypothetical protein [Gemmatimonadaceae bacterium]